MEIANGLIKIDWFSIFTGLFSIAVIIGVIIIVHFVKNH